MPPVRGLYALESSLEGRLPRRDPSTLTDKPASALPTGLLALRTLNSRQSNGCVPALQRTNVKYPRPPWLCAPGFSLPSSQMAIAQRPDDARKLRLPSFRPSLLEPY